MARKVQAGRPAHSPTQETRIQVKTLAAVGVRHEDIAAKLGISSDTLVKYYRRELDDGRVDANATIAKSLFDQAKAGNTTAQIFWLKTRAGWKDTQTIEHTGVDGGAIETVTRIELVALTDGNSAN